MVLMVLPKIRLAKNIVVGDLVHSDCFSLTMRMRINNDNDDYPLVN